MIGLNSLISGLVVMTKNFMKKKFGILSQEKTHRDTADQRPHDQAEAVVDGDDPPRVDCYQVFHGWK